MNPAVPNSGPPPYPQYGTTFPDLRAFIPPGPPPLPSLPLNAKLTKDERKAREQHSRARAEFVKAHRRDPMPPGVWVVRVLGRYTALRALGPGRVESWNGHDTEPQQFAVAGLTRGWWRGSRLKLVGPAGESLVLRTVNPGSVGLAAVGDREASSADSLGNDPISTIVGMLFLIYALFASPWLIAKAMRRRRIRNEVANAVRPR